MRQFLILLLLLPALCIFAQKGAVKGFVLDKATGEAIPYATVKLEGTDFGAATDDQGFFNIPNIPEGSYTVVMSYVGYESQKQNVDIKKGKTVSVKILMPVSDIELQSVEINA